MEKGLISTDNIEALGYAKQHAGELISGIDETTRKSVQSLFSKAFENGWSRTQTRDTLTKEFKEFGKVRALLIAQMETAIAHEQGQDTRFRKIAEKHNLTGWKRSQTQGDERTRASHRQNELDGWIPNDEAFSGTGTMMAPHGFRCCCVTIRRLFEPTDEEKLEVLPTNEILNKIGKIYKTEIENTLKNYPNMIHTEVCSIIQYTGGGFNDINNFHRFGVYTDNTELISLYLDRALKKLPNYSGTAYRGIDGEFAEKIQAMKMGEVLMDKGYMSTTDYLEITQGFLNITMKITIKNGKDIQKPFNQGGKGDTSGTKHITGICRNRTTRRHSFLSF